MKCIRAYLGLFVDDVVMLVLAMLVLSTDRVKE